jgi:coenzyme F420 hydrogenase subunit beta
MPELDKFVFGQARQDKPDDHGIFRTCARAWATDDKVRGAGSSGGVVTALLVYALEKGLIDCALVAGFDKEQPWRAVPVLATTADEIKAASKSILQPVAPTSLLTAAMEKGFEKIGVVGLPCAVHGLRKMQYDGLARRASERIAVIIGLFCNRQGYFLATKHALIDWCHIDDFRQIESIQYRGGDYPHNFVVKLKNGEKIELQRPLYTARMHGPSGRDRCLMCIDWTAELSDISVGDYFHRITKAGEDPRRSSVIIRTAKGEELFGLAQRDGHIYAEGIPPSDLTSSGGGFEAKKHIAAFRLTQRQRCGWPVPNFHYRPDYSAFKRRTPVSDRGEVLVTGDDPSP